MAGEWSDVSIEDIATKIAMGPFGSDIKTDNFVPAGVPIIRGGNLTSGRFNGEEFVYLTEEKADELLNSNAYPSDVVFTHRGTLGQVGLVPDNPFKRYVVSQSQMKLTCMRCSNFLDQGQSETQHARSHEQESLSTLHPGVQRQGRRPAQPW
jgi:type I restriction enzyme S subunit